MNNTTIKTEIKISFDNDFINRQYNITPAQAKLLQELAQRVQGKIDKILIRKLEKLAKENPNLPQIKNFITVAYNKVDNYAKVIEVNDQLLEEFPDYLHARINAANHYIHIDEPQHALAYLGKNLNLGTLFPNRSEFHFSEVCAYYFTTVLYAVAIKNLPLAENRLELYKSIDTDNPQIKMLEDRVGFLKLYGSDDSVYDLNELIGNVPPGTDRINPPTFNHPEIHKLYHLGFQDAKSVLDEILVLPRATVIQDLELVLQDGIERYPYFSEEVWSVFTHSFPLHAMFLLMELKSTSSLKPVLNFLHYDEHFLNLYIGDFLIEDIWQCVYILGKEQVILLKEFLKEPGVYYFAKSAVSQTLLQISIIEPHRFAEIEQVFSEMAIFFIIANQEDNVIDTTFIGLLVGDIGDGKFENLNPLVEQLYELDYVDFSLEGDFDDFIDTTKETSWSSYSLRTLTDIYSSTDFREESDSSGIEKNSFFDAPVDEAKVIQLIPEKQVKVQRNDPCPCGSGKKYKKCCG